jgi:hypothetical protein
MAREDFSRDARRDRDAGRARRPTETRDADDFGQADYSMDYGYDARRRAGYRAEDDRRPLSEDYGQADYSNDYAYDPERGRAYRRFSEDDRDYSRPADDRRDYARDADRRSFMDRAGEFFSGSPRRDDDVRAARRRGPSDRVLWAIIVERLEDERRLDLRDVDVIVENGEVTLNGTVRRKEDKRRIEDVADIDGVRHVQNNLRVRERGLF